MCSPNASGSDYRAKRPPHLTAPDRPGDRDQQQAAELADELEAASYAWNEYGAEREQDYRAARADIAAALAAARAEEAARWRAKIEALRELARYAQQYHRDVMDAADVRALLDGEQR